MITSITDSDELAAVLNADPLTPEDAAETPRDWLAGIKIGLGGPVYPLDPDATTETLAVLANGTAAVRLSPGGEHCGRQHGKTAFKSTASHWCPADCVTWTAGSGVRGVFRDWRSVRVWDNSFDETTVHDTVEKAKAAFDEEIAQMETNEESERTSTTTM
ncbi:hypothetical protein AB0C84_35700 [Actinomadura sp. NPDC048955]|uniref:hypothetical protein n=1 Tax=Actinomadura sp. NPDC048955 TaxID=3158228 RepID=UPI0033FAE713